jgi:hypothetical protein
VQKASNLMRSTQKQGLNPWKKAWLKNWLKAWLKIVA